MRMQKAPDHLTTHTFNGKDELGVLPGGKMARLQSGLRNSIAQGAGLFRRAHILGPDNASTRIAGTG